MITAKAWKEWKYIDNNKNAAELAIASGDLPKAALFYKSLYEYTHDTKYDQLAKRIDIHLEIDSQDNLTIPDILSRVTYVPDNLNIDVGKMYNELYKNVQVQPYMMAKALSILTSH